MLRRASAAAGDEDDPAVEGDFSGPNMRVNWLSLYRLKLMFTVDVAKNLAGPAVVLGAGVEYTVLHSVSVVLAVMYVLK